MADTQLLKIAALTDRLSALGGKARGMPIEAQDWNGLVAVLQGILEIDRTQQEQQRAALSENFAPRAHEHLGQVAAAWLDADLQGHLGSADAPASVLLRLAQMETRLAGVNRELARLSSLSDGQQTAIDRFAVADLNRAKSVRDFATQIGSLDEIQTKVTAVTTDLAGIKSGMQSVLDLRRVLTGPDGAALDVAGMRQEVTDLQRLRDNLKGADGSLIRVRDIESRLKEVEDVAGTTAVGGLDARLVAVAAGLETRLKDDQGARFAGLREQLTAEASQRNEALKRDMGTAVDAALAGSAQSQKALLDRTAADLRAESATRLAAGLASAKQEQTDATRGIVADQMAGVTGQIDAAIAGARAGILQAAGTVAAERAGAAVQAALPAAEERMNARLGTAVAQLQQSQTESATRLRGELTAAVTGLRGDIGSAVDGRVVSLQQTLSSTLTSSVKAEVTAALPGLTAAAGAIIDQRLGTLDTRIATAVGEATRAIPDTVASSVRLQLTALNLPGQIGAATAQLTQQFRTELSTAVSAQQDRSATALGAAMTQLRGETAAAVKAGTDDVFTRAGALVGSVRGELATAVNGLRTELRADIRTETQRVSTDFSSRLSQVDTRRATGPAITVGGVGGIRPVNP